MDEIKRIKKSLQLLLVLIPFTELATPSSSIIVRAGAEATLPCDKVRDDHVNCGAATWLFTYSVWSGAVNLFVNRQLDTSKISKSKADRLRLAADCSLVIREVTAEDAGRYECRQFDLKTQTREDHRVLISVVNVTEHSRTDEVKLSCFLTPSGICTEVKWLYMNLDVPENNTDLKTSQFHCSANVRFSKDKIKNYSSLTCKVKDFHNEGTFSLIPPSSAKNKPAPGNNEMSTDWWWYIRLVVGFAAMVILVVILIGWRRNKIQGGDVAVAFDTVEAPSSSTGPSADPSSPYANVTFIQ
ncbi:uncharacterized protein LOC128450539 isoform X2 [Pleuronectes platessa]|uniref:uncharacterized protein LOC128450539 isoform X2 n=1 Tax=Pleuronectes platessa TaxID=8262 RepID=UPI00232A6A1A|nr:uncharacterized protein LOC128450539 isoform X2 [Pleuronectes platessa]